MISWIELDDDVEIEPASLIDFTAEQTEWKASILEGETTHLTHDHDESFILTRKIEEREEWRRDTLFSLLPLAALVAVMIIITTVPPSLLQELEQIILYHYWSWWSIIPSSWSSLKKYLSEYQYWSLIVAGWWEILTENGWLWMTILKQEWMDTSKIKPNESLDSFLNNTKTNNTEVLREPNSKQSQENWRNVNCMHTCELSNCSIEHTEFVLSQFTVSSWLIHLLVIKVCVARERSETKWVILTWSDQQVPALITSQIQRQSWPF